MAKRVCRTAWRNYAQQDFNKSANDSRRDTKGIKGDKTLVKQVSGAGMWGPKRTGQGLSDLEMETNMAIPPFSCALCRLRPILFLKIRDYGLNFSRKIFYSAEKYCSLFQDISHVWFWIFSSGHIGQPHTPASNLGEIDQAGGTYCQD